MKTWHYIAILAVAVWCIAGPMVGFYKGKSCLPTIEEIQERIGCEKVDGILGDETQEKWNAAICKEHWLKLADSL